MSTPDQAPIVLVPGLLGFDRVCVGRFELRRYFRGIEEQLEGAGHAVHVARLRLTRGVADRALELRRFIRRKVHAQRVHLFAHSMGGLDARLMISKLDMADQVLSLTTIGTPHRGTSFADWGIHKASWCIKPILRSLQISPHAFHDLTTENCLRFNEEVIDAPGVRYLSVAGRRDLAAFGLLWRLPAHIVYEREGANDGVVSIQSANYGEHCDIWEADHLNLINWPSRASAGQDFSRNYLDLAKRATG